MLSRKLWHQHQLKFSVMLPNNKKSSRKAPQKALVMVLSVRDFLASRVKNYPQSNFSWPPINSFLLLSWLRVISPLVESYFDLRELTETSTKTTRYMRYFTVSVWGLQLPEMQFYIFTRTLMMQFTKVKEETSLIHFYRANSTKWKGEQENENPRLFIAFSYFGITEDLSYFLIHRVETKN